MSRRLEGDCDGSGLRIGVIASRFNRIVTDRLLEGALRTLEESGVNADDVTVVSVPGALELGIAAKTLAETGRFDALVALGAVIKGETSHYDVVVERGCEALSRAALSTGVPIGMGVLTTSDLQQALNRAGGRNGDKGREAALVAIEMANLLKTIREQSGG